MTQTLCIVKVRPRGDDERYEPVLYTLSPERAQAAAREHNPGFPERERWEPHVFIDEVALDQDIR